MLSGYTVLVLASSRVTSEHTTTRRFEHSRTVHDNYLIQPPAICHLTLVTNTHTNVSRTADSHQHVAQTLHVSAGAVVPAASLNQSRVGPSRAGRPPSTRVGPQMTSRLQLPSRHQQHC